MNGSWRHLRAIIRKALKQAVEDGSWRARQFLFDYVVGRPRQSIEVKDRPAFFEVIERIMSARQADALTSSAPDQLPPGEEGQNVED